MSDSDATNRIRVIKFGGSLIGDNGALRRFKLWIQSSRNLDSRTYLIAGGGSKVGQLRQNQKQYGTCDYDAHWNAIRIMDNNTRLLANEIHVPVIDVSDSNVTKPDSMKRKKGVVATICEPLVAKLDCLPEDWSVSSDSIAGTLAGFLAKRDASVELVLLKSATPTVHTDATRRHALAQLSEFGFVDEYFPQVPGICRLATIDIVNLRDEPIETVRL